MIDSSQLFLPNTSLKDAVDPQHDLLDKSKQNPESEQTRGLQRDIEDSAQDPLWGFDGRCGRRRLQEARAPAPAQLVWKRG